MHACNVFEALWVQLRDASQIEEHYALSRKLNLCKEQETIQKKNLFVETIQLEICKSEVNIRQLSQF